MSRFSFLRPLAPALVVLGLALSFAGCAHYRAGTGAELPFESIYIRPAENESFAPQAQALVSAQVREAFIRDGRLKVLADESEADAVLLITLTEYDRAPAARLGDDTVEAQDFELELSALVSLYDANRGDFLFANRALSERNLTYVQDLYGTDLEDTQAFVQAEYQNMPQLARGLARKIADQVLSPW